LKWGGELDESLKQVESEGKPALLFFTTDWHSADKKMGWEMFSNANVRASLEQCVLVRVHPEPNEKNRALAERLQVERASALVILNAQSEVVLLCEGARQADQFAQ
jgi:thiol:disulfide interchange protein